MNLSFSTRGWGDLSWEELLDAALDMKFTGIEVYNLFKFPALTDRGGPFHKHKIAATVRQLREKKLTIPCFDTSCDLTTDGTAVDTLLKARRIYVLGVRSTAALANFFGYYMNFMFPDVHVVTASGAHEMFEKIVSVNSDDVIIAFSFPRYSASTTKGARYCRSAGATVIGITDSKDSPLGQCCDHVLLAKSDMLSLVDSLVAPLSLVNALIVGVSQRREKELARRLGALESIWEDYNVYEKRADKA